MRIFPPLRLQTRPSATAAGLYQVIGKEIDDRYIAQVKAQVVNHGGYR